MHLVLASISTTPVHIKVIVGSNDRRIYSVLQLFLRTKINNWWQDQFLAKNSHRISDPVLMAADERLRNYGWLKHFVLLQF
jgi:hypothetical protein